MDKSLLLSNTEKERFLYWLHNQLNSCNGILKQFEKLPSNISEELTKREKTKILGFMIVINELEAGEAFQIEK